MPLKIVRNDITTMQVDAIVNAANSSLQMGGGVCGAIFTAAGAAKLQKACDSIGSCHVGDAVITEGFDLPAQYVIHTVGPVWHGGNQDEAQYLEACYRHSLELALEKNLESIAFPLIASGIFGYPKDEALSIAVATIGKFLLQHDMLVYLVVYDKKAFVLSEKLMSTVERYIDDHYVESHIEERNLNRLDDYVIYPPTKEPFGAVKSKKRTAETSATKEKALDESIVKTQEEEIVYESFNIRSNITLDKQVKPKRRLEDVVKNLDETFSQMLLRLIDEKGLSDVETYKRANVDRRLFSKIRSDKHYNPSKMTVIAFAIAMKLSCDETVDFLRKAGYALSPASLFDMIVQCFIENEMYNVHEINLVLYQYDLPLICNPEE